MALILGLVEEAVNSLPLPPTIQGPRGYSGRDGLDFSFEDHKEEIQKIILKAIPSKEELIGERGIDGRKGKDFSFEDHKEDIINILSNVIDSMRGELKFTFDDFTPEQLNYLKGLDGKDGKDFIFEEHFQSLEEIIQKNIPDKEELRFKYDDFTFDQIELLRGEKGRDGRDGNDFDLEDNLEFIQQTLTSMMPNKEELKLKFEDYTPEQLNALRFKFEDYTEEQLNFLRGPKGARGQKGWKGDTGEKGEKGEIGEQGIPGKDGRIGPRGAMGTQGPKGSPGDNGLNAPAIVDVELLTTPNKDQIYFRFDFDDNTSIDTNKVDIPKGKVISQNIFIPFSGSTNAEANVILTGVLCDPAVYIGAAVKMGDLETVYNAQADTYENSLVIGIVEKIYGDRCDVRVLGVTDTIFIGLDITKEYFLSADTPGLITTVVPTLPTQVKVRLGQPFSSMKFLVIKGERTERQ